MNVSKRIVTKERARPHASMFGSMLIYRDIFRRQHRPRAACRAFEATTDPITSRVDHDAGNGRVVAEQSSGLVTRFDVSSNSVPEPGSIALVGIGGSFALALATPLRRRSRAA